MGFSIGTLMEACLLFVNGLAVLQDYSPSLKPGAPPVPRFLANIGWTADESGYGKDTSIKGKLITFVNAIRTVTRVPLIGVNILTILYLIFLG
eukprot:m.341338 g.341338  ORF g.341338 m.341338 type:complete len:93 (-) comp20020_c0_seq1:88-366(-)